VKEAEKMSNAGKLGLLVLALALAGCGDGEDEGANNAAAAERPMFEEEASNGASAYEDALDVSTPDGTAANLARPDPGEWKEPANDQGGKKGPP
jgi:hypothetical protein